MTTATQQPASIALPRPDDDGYPETQPEPMPETKPERPIHTPLTDSVKSERYKKLTEAEVIVLGMLDSCCPTPDAVSWFCEWEHLVKLASVSPAIAEDRIMGAIGSLREFKIIDVCIGSTNGQPGVFVAAHQHRARLLRDFMQHTIKEKRELVDQVATAA